MFSTVSFILSLNSPLHPVFCLCILSLYPQLYFIYPDCPRLQGPYCAFKDLTVQVCSCPVPTTWPPGTVLDSTVNLCRCVPGLYVTVLYLYLPPPRILDVDAVLLLGARTS